MQIFPFIAHSVDGSKTKFDDSFYEIMRQDFNSLFDKGYFKSLVDKPCYYILQIIRGNKTATGLLSLTNIQEYVIGNIKKHEQTLPKKEALHKSILTSRKAMIKPAAMIMPVNKKIYTYLLAIQSTTKPAVHIKYPDNKTIQKLWIVDEQKFISSITSLFKKEIKKTIIADGHHRFASMSSLQSKGYSKILTAYFSVDQMEVFTFYRIFSPLKNESNTYILSQLQKISSSWKKVRSIPQNSQDTFYLIHNKIIYAFTLKKSKSSLWVHAFEQKITKGIFNIKKETDSKRVSYENSIMSKAEFTSMINKYNANFIFKLPAVSPEQVLHTKKLLPPKSTYFIPRIINGIVVCGIEK